MDFATKLKTLRKSKKLTQEQLASMINVERSSVGKYETGVMPSMDVLQRIAAVFDVSIDYLMGYTNKGTPKVSEEDLKIALFGGDKEVSDEMWNEVLDYAKYLKQKYNKP